MIRIGRMTDYGIVLLAVFVRQEESKPLTARDLSRDTELPLPTVSKLLKTLCRGGVLESQRGVNGGYQLSRSPHDVAVVEVIELLEGPIAVTECCLPGEELSACSLETHCPAKGNWQKISLAIRGALAGVSLAEMVSGSSPTEARAKPSCLGPDGSAPAN